MTKEYLSSFAPLLMIGPSWPYNNQRNIIILYFHYLEENKNRDDTARGIPFLPLDCECKYVADLGRIPTAYY